VNGKLRQRARDGRFLFRKCSPFSMSSRSRGSGGQSAAALSTPIAQAREQEASAVAEGERLAALVAWQESLIGKQREALAAVPETSSQLPAVEQQRSAIKAQLAAQKSRLGTRPRSRRRCSGRWRAARSARPAGQVGAGRPGGDREDRGDCLHGY
jgi:hypothetical protein